MPRNRQLTEKRILEAALSLLGEAGFETWGVNEVARRAGVDKVLIYRYYASLEGLLEAVVRATEFWPDPDLLPDHSPGAFIEATIAALEGNPQARPLLAHSGTRASLSGIRRKFSDELDRWLNGLRTRTRGSIASDQLELLPALIHFQFSTGRQNLSPRDLWAQVAPPLEWAAEGQWPETGELPTELL